MDSTLILCFIVMPFLLGQVNSSSSEVPTESCDTLSPNSSYHGAMEQTNSVTFEIDKSVFKNPFSDELHYSPNSSYWISLRPSRCSITFRGFLIQALLVDDNTTVVGSFATPLRGLPDYYQLSSCARQEGTVTHSSETDKTSVSILWTSPPSSTGDIRFRFTVLLLDNVYLADQMTAVLVERQCPIPLYWDSASISCIIQCPLFTFGNHTIGLCQPFPDLLTRHVQADATAYFGSVEIGATPGTKIFSFRIIVSLRRFGNDLDAIVVSLVRSNFVEKIFSFNNSQTEVRFLIGNEGGIDAVNASRVFPEIRLIENRLVVYKDSIIYRESPTTCTALEFLTTFDFDFNLIVIGQNSYLKNSHHLLLEQYHLRYHLFYVKTMTTAQIQSLIPIHARMVHFAEITYVDHSSVFAMLDGQFL